ncbi:hypothetical protein LNKW23_17930 [Paralimibaculum aggregatum]|uniref:Uncharacterized protein n=1 Tax=Paralimibaculum aggregatum TaxID=3036245 RepID=A0ABQ6LK22_9RHOB|nr:hypothetical protein LNKW23_17930 [Limibaculum sp. NKW23]
MTTPGDSDDGVGLLFRLQATVSQFESDMNRARRAMDRTAKQMEKRAERLDEKLSKVGGKLGKGLSRGAQVVGGGGLLAGIGGGLTLQSVEKTARALDAIGKKADAIGVTTDFLQQMRAVAEDFGVEMGRTDKAMENFVRRMAEARAGTGEAKKVVEELGIEFEDANGNLKSSAELAYDFATAVASLDNPADQLRALQKVMGEEGGGLVNLFRLGGDEMRRLAEETSATGQVVREDLIRSAEDSITKLGQLERTMAAARAEAKDRLAPALIKIQEALNAVERAAYGAAGGLSEAMAISEPDQKMLFGAEGQAAIDAFMGKGSGSGGTRLGPQIPGAGAPGLLTGGGGSDGIKGSAGSDLLGLSGAGTGRAGKSFADLARDARTYTAALGGVAQAGREVQISTEEWTGAAEDAQRANDALARTVGDIFARGIAQAEDWREALISVGTELLKLIGQGLFGQGAAGGFFNQLFGVASGGLAGLAFSGGGGGSLGIGTGGLYAKGGVFGPAGPITAFARGGVVNGPTLFPFAGGTGLMGEAGPEAILPLRKGPGGRLGVEGGSSRPVSITQTITVQGDASEAVLRELERRLAASNREILRRIPGVAADASRRGGAVGGAIQGRF